MPVVENAIVVGTTLEAVVETRDRKVSNMVAVVVTVVAQATMIILNMAVAVVAQATMVILNMAVTVVAQVTMVILNMAVAGPTGHTVGPTWRVPHVGWAGRVPPVIVCATPDSGYHM